MRNLHVAHDGVLRVLEIRLSSLLNAPRLSLSHVCQLDGSLFLRN